MTKRKELSRGSPPPTGSKPPVASGQGTRLANRRLMATDPNREQFPPTESFPIRQNARMAGVE